MAGNSAQSVASWSRPGRLSLVRRRGSDAAREMVRREPPRLSHPEDGRGERPVHHATGFQFPARLPSGAGIRPDFRRALPALPASHRGLANRLRAERPTGPGEWAGTSPPLRRPDYVTVNSSYSWHRSESRSFQATGIGRVCVWYLGGKPPRPHAPNIRCHRLKSAPSQTRSLKRSTGSFAAQAIPRSSSTRKSGSSNVHE